MQALDLPKPVAFVLGGGGSLGALQVGMLQALDEAGIAPDLAVGTSVGSLNAAVLALPGDDRIGRLRDIWAHMTKAEAFPGGVLSQVRTLRHSKTHLFPNTGLAKIVDDHLGAGRRFEDLALPLGVVTTDVDTAEPVLLTSGPLRAPCWRAARSRASTRRCRTRTGSCTTAAWSPTSRCGRRSAWARNRWSSSTARFPAKCPARPGPSPR
ncbi:patatin-like phospholipase family protein [Amycolatopsis sp. WGS_07]